MKKTYLFVMTGAVSDAAANSRYILPTMRCEAFNESEAVAIFEQAGERLCMNTAVMCLNDLPVAHYENSN